MIFNIIIDWIMNRAGANLFAVGKDLSVQDLDYADDIALLADSVKVGQTFLAVSYTHLTLPTKRIV